MTAQTIDDGDAGFNTTGTWLYYPGPAFDYYEEDVTYINYAGVNGSSSDTANWTFTGLDPGTYTVENHWVDDLNRATNVSITIFDGSTPLHTVSQDQRDNQNISRWGGLGAYTINSGTLKVSMSGVANGVVVADAVRIDQVSAPTLPNVSISSAQKVEGDSGTSNATFTISLSSAVDFPVTVDYRTSAITATSNTDYIHTANSHTFSPGQTSFNVSVPVVGDTLAEVNETFALEVWRAFGVGSIGTPGLGTIIDDDLALTVSNVSATEGNSGNKSFVFDIELSQEVDEEIDYHFVTSNGSAVSGVDYVFKEGDRHFDANETHHTITVDVIGEVLNEADETFQLNVSIPSLGLSAYGVGTIENDDSLPTISIGDAEAVTEGNSPATTNAEFPVTLSAASGQTVTVHYRTIAGTATGGSDYTSVTSGTLTFSPGSTTPQNAIVAVKGDNRDEEDEQFTVELFGFSNVSAGTTTTATGTIIDDDAPPTISVDNVSVHEGDIGTSTLMFTVSLSEVSDYEVSVDYTVAEDSAKMGTDFVAEPATGTLTFTPGQPYQPVFVSIVNDLNVEPTEMFRLNLTNAVNASIAGAGYGIATIFDNDVSRNRDKDDSDCNCDCGCTGVSKEGTVTQSGKTISAREGNVAHKAGGTTGNTSENPHPIISVDMTLPEGEVPELIEAELTFDGVPQGPVFYNTTGLSPGDPLKFVLQADATELATGHYGYTVDITSHFPDDPSTTVSTTGATEVINRIDSEFGNRRWVEELDRLVLQTGGVALIRGDDTSAWYEEDGSGGYITPAGSFGELVQNLDNSFTLTHRNGRKHEFDAAGLLTAEVDRFGSETTYTYTNADADDFTDELSQITDPFGRTTTYAYDEGSIEGTVVHELTHMLDDLNDWYITPTAWLVTGWLEGPAPRKMEGLGYSAQHIIENINLLERFETNLKRGFYRTCEQIDAAWQSAWNQLGAYSNTEVWVYGSARGILTDADINDFEAHTGVNISHNAVYPIYNELVRQYFCCCDLTPAKTAPALQ